MPPRDRPSGFGPFAPLALLALAALAAGGCGDEGGHATGKKPAEKNAPAELSWQIRQFRLSEPCRGGGGAARQSAVQPAAPVLAPGATTPAAAPAAPATPPPAAAAPAGGEPAAAESAPTEPVTAPAPPPPDPSCVRFSAVYPEFEKGLQRALLVRLNEAVRDLVTSPSFDERRAGSVDGTGRRLIAAWKARQLEKRPAAAGPGAAASPGAASPGADSAGAAERWYDERKVDIVYRDEKTISFRLEERLFAGGAHELATALYVSYSLDRIDRLSMADLFVEGSARQLNELGEKKFREQRAIPPGRSLADAGFDFPNGLFRLSANFAVQADAVLFRYNPYDVGPYALGATEVVLSKSELKDLIRPKGPLGGQTAPPAAAPVPAAPAAVAPAAAEPEAPSTEGG